MTEQVRLIKKYPNRRLYDTRTSSYITLSDVKDLVMAFENFKVVDAKTNEDLTRGILLQIILEEESGGMPLFSSEILSQMIRFYGHSMQGMLGKYLESNMKAFVEFQSKLQEQSQTLYGSDTVNLQPELWAQFLSFQGPAMQNMMTSYIDQSRKMFQQMQSQIETQTRNMLTGFPFPGVAGPDGKIDKP
jgi:polyhydroxyalkanoate synthesis repressor PhaR